jgi:hypothetical protein
MVKCKSMHQLIYCSMVTREMLEADILDLLKVACDKNDLLELIGLLVCQKRTNKFLQIMKDRRKSFLIC